MRDSVEGEGSRIAARSCAQCTPPCAGAKVPKLLLPQSRTTGQQPAAWGCGPAGSARWRTHANSASPALSRSRRPSLATHAGVLALAARLCIDGSPTSEASGVAPPPAAFWNDGCFPPLPHPPCPLTCHSHAARRAGWPTGDGRAQGTLHWGRGKRGKRETDKRRERV